jgi:hypothetical protein
VFLTRTASVEELGEAGALQTSILRDIHRRLGLRVSIAFSNFGRKRQHELEESTGTGATGTTTGPIASLVALHARTGCVTEALLIREERSEHCRTSSGVPRHVPA